MSGFGLERQRQIFLDGLCGRKPAIPIQPAALEEGARRVMTPEGFAYVAGDGTPRVVATWFHWTGEVARIDLHPTRVGVLDFQTRLPSALGGIS